MPESLITQGHELRETRILLAASRWFLRSQRLISLKPLGRAWLPAAGHAGVPAGRRAGFVNAALWLFRQRFKVLEEGRIRLLDAR
jgi:hypothetical protein